MLLCGISTHRDAIRWNIKSRSQIRLTSRCSEASKMRLYEAFPCHSIYTRGGQDERSGTERFSVAAPRISNRLHTELKIMRSTAAFKWHLKTFFFIFFRQCNAPSVKCRGALENPQLQLQLQFPSPCCGESAPQRCSVMHLSCLSAVVCGTASVRTTRSAQYRDTFLQMSASRRLVFGLQTFQPHSRHRDSCIHTPGCLFIRRLAGKVHRRKIKRCSCA